MLVVTGIIAAAGAGSRFRASLTETSFATPAAASTVTPFGTGTGQAADLRGAGALAGTGASAWSLLAITPDTSRTAYLTLGLATASVAGAVTSIGVAAYYIHKSVSAPIAWAGASLASEKDPP